MQLEIDKYHLRLRGIRTRQLAGRRTPIVNGNSTTLLARSILMVRSITWWIGFRIWCEALYYGRQEWKCWGRRSMTTTIIARLIESVSHVGQIDDFPITPLEQQSFLLTGFSLHKPCRLSSCCVCYRGGKSYPQGYAYPTPTWHSRQCRGHYLAKE
jgi:hypothetical protein